MINIPYKTTWQMAIIGGLCGACNVIIDYPFLETGERLYSSVMPGLLLGFALFLYFGYRKINERFDFPYHILFFFITVISYAAAFNYAVEFGGNTGPREVDFFISGIIGGFIFSGGFKIIEPKISWIKGIIVPTILGGVIAYAVTGSDSSLLISWVTWQACMCGYFGFLIDRILKKGST